MLLSPLPPGMGIRWAAAAEPVAISPTEVLNFLVGGICFR